MRGWLSAFLVFLVALMAGPAMAQQKIALVIGISDYKVGGKLPQTLIDAGKVSASLTEVGFSTTTLVKPNLSKAELEDALLAFSEKAERADVAVLYFAGHGMQYADDNWLIPASADLRSEAHIRLQGVPLADVVELMKPARFKIIILDACRNNPFVLRWGATRSAGEGLGRMIAAAIPTGSLVAFSAAAGQKVPDNGVYADALARWIKAEGIELRQLFDRVRRDVQQKTPTAAPEYTTKYDGLFSFTAGHTADPAALAPDQMAQARISELEQRLAELEKQLRAAPPTTGAASSTVINALVESGIAAYRREDYDAAADSWRTACEGGHAIGCATLASLYELGHGVEPDDKEARRLYSKACSAGSDVSCAGLGAMYESGRGGAQDFDEARRLYQKTCTTDETSGCVYLGRLYLTGVSVAQDLSQAKMLFEMSCNDETVLGCAGLGSLYASGAGATQDFAEALRLFEKACEGGNVSGCAGLANLYVDGLGLEKDLPEARRLYEASCEAGEPTACVLLGDLLREGQSFTQDYPQALRLYQKACDWGIPTGCTNTAGMYLNGFGVTQDYAHASIFYDRACGGGEMMACIMSGDLRLDQGGPGDRDGALQLYRQACEAGEEDGCTRLREAEKTP